MEFQLQEQGVEVKKDICEHFAYSRQEIYHLVRVNHIRSFEQLAGASQDQLDEILTGANLRRISERDVLPFSISYFGHSVLGYRRTEANQITVSVDIVDASD